MLKFALVLFFVSLARGQNANAQSQVQQYSGGSEPYAFGQNQGAQAQSAYAQSQGAQVQSALAGQTMPGMAQTGGIGQWQNPYVNYYQNQGMAAPMGGAPMGAAMGGPMMQEGRRFLGGYGLGPAVMGPPVMGAPIYGGGMIGAPIGVGMGYPYYRK